ncbi:ATP-binding protein [Mesorhizobium sp. B2-5-4]|uniref:ATP-binding protein n=1 Tax=Mesorhizobium sp. B2-5-4 TaxID=2589926 RepID=UPI0015E38432|nr:ATP-binding protein [Mesorhizobium sp. B2-5-4]
MTPPDSTLATVIGTVQDVSGTTVSVTLGSGQHSGLTFVRGQGYRIGQIGSFVKIPVGYTELFGIVSQVGASAVPASKVSEHAESHRWMTVQLIGEGHKSESFQRGISQYPTIDDEVHLVSESDLQAIYGRVGALNNYVKVGHITGSESIDALVDINKLVTRHSAIVGTTGSGKSTTVAGILSALSDPDRFPSARIVVLDLHGEYAKALGARANIFRINPNAKAANELPLRIPYWALNFDEMLRLTFGSLPADGKARNIILERVIAAKAAFLRTYPVAGIDEASVGGDSPVPFSLNKLWHDLYCAEFGTYNPAIGNPTDPSSWTYEKDGAGEAMVGDAMKGVAPRFRRVKDVKGDEEKIRYLPDPLNLASALENLGSKLRVSRFDFLLKAGDWHPALDGRVEKDLPELIKQWIGSARSTSIIDLSGVPSSMTNDIIGVVLRVLYDALFWARNLSEGGRERPLLIVMEEAHNYLNSASDGLAASIVRRVVKEGRKYGIGAMIVSQRPAEIDPTILSQCGTFFALRLSNATDRSHVTSTLSDNLEGLTNMLPILRTGEAIVLGEAVSMPMRASIQAPPKDRRPDSQDPLVCDVQMPEDSQSPGGWNIRLNADASYDDFVRVWRQQNPSLTNSDEA